jgi:hypothetical protein
MFLRLPLPKLAQREDDEHYVRLTSTAFYCRMQVHGVLHENQLIHQTESLPLGCGKR